MKSKAHSITGTSTLRIPSRWSGAASWQIQRWLKSLKPIYNCVLWPHLSSVCPIVISPIPRIMALEPLVTLAWPRWEFFVQHPHLPKNSIGSSKTVRSIIVLSQTCLTTFQIGMPKLIHHFADRGIKTKENKLHTTF